MIIEIAMGIVLGVILLLFLPWIFVAVIVIAGILIVGGSGWVIYMWHFTSEDVPMWAGLTATAVFMCSCFALATIVDRSGHI